MDNPSFWDIAESLGTVSVLAGAVWAFTKGLIIPKPTHDKMLADKDARIKFLETEVLERLEK